MYHKDIGGVALKNASLIQRKKISEVCEKRGIEAFKSIIDPDAKSMKEHPHIQYHSRLVDSFRGKHPNFVSFNKFVEFLI